MSTPEEEAIAIVGYGGIFPGAGDPETLWANVVQAVDATTEVPPERWLLHPDAAFDAHIARPDKVYSKRGGFISRFTLDPAGLNVDEALLGRLDPLFHLSLHTAIAAWRSCRTDSLDRSRVGVIFGNIVLPTEGSSSFSRELLGKVIESRLGLRHTTRKPAEPLNAFPAGLPAAFVAQALGLGGPQFTLDAACASSLYALKLAVDELRSGRADAMISGGVSRPDPLYTQMGFSQLMALSARGKPAPFDVQADGLVVGEGAGLFVLKRLSDALGQGDVIHGLIRGIGLSNDVHGDLLAPSSEGQLRALRAAYAQAGWSPLDVDLIECHATGTPLGDAVEVASLKTLWGDRAAGWSPGQCTIGSVKSNVGHMLTAAGAAGLLKVLLALKHKTLPPTANHVQPAPRLELESSPFRVLNQATPWTRRDPSCPRRAAISGFGFGGINAHVLIEEWPASAPQTLIRSAPQPPLPARDPCSVAIVGMAAHVGPFQGLRSFQEQVFTAKSQPRPVSPGRWWCAANEQGAVESGSPGNCLPGHYLNDLRLRVDRFRIPPRELRQMLPQQSLMLEVAAEALGDANWDRASGPRTGVVIGLGLDQNTNNYQLRWWIAGQAAEWNEQLGLGLSDTDLESWVEKLKDAVGPPLTADRTMGSLGGVVASRIAREFRIGGPSFAVACDETSGTQALQIAIGWLDRHELDTVVVGSVDLAGDHRAVRAADTVSGPARPGEGACAMVLKRLDDAVRDGDRIYAVIRDVKTKTTEPIKPPEPDEAIFSSHGSIGSVRPAIGRPGAATGLAAVVRSALSLYQQIVPGSGHEDREPGGPQYWLRNPVDGPRRAEVRAFGLGGSVHAVFLEAAADDWQPRVVIERERDWPAGAHDSAIFALEADDRRRLLERARELLALGDENAEVPVARLAGLWWNHRRADPALGLGLVVLAMTVPALRRGLLRIVQTIEAGQELEEMAIREADLEVIPPRLASGSPPRVAFVYPGLGNVFAGMGRAMSVLWPQVCRAQDTRLESLRDQFLPGLWWNQPLPAEFPDHRLPILGQVAVGSLATEVMALFGVVPAGAIGYSMGESAALVALRAWTDRDALARALMNSPLFASELAGPCRAARRVWRLDDSEPVDWLAGIVTCPPAELEAALAGRSRVYLLIRNTEQEAVIGGQRRAVRELIDTLGCVFLELPIVSTVHCEIGRAVQSDYHALHDQPTSVPDDILFYSGVSGRAYRPDRASAADAITAQATQPVDFPAVINRAYADGFRVFLEMGPGGSCTRLIGRILAQRPHVTCAVCLPGENSWDTVLRALGQLIAYRVVVNLDPLFGRPADDLAPTDQSEHAIAVALGPQLPHVLPRPDRSPIQATRIRERTSAVPPAAVVSVSLPVPEPVLVAGSALLPAQMAASRAAVASAHEAFLRVSQGYNDLLGRGLTHQLSLIEELARMDPAEHEPARNESRPRAPGVSCFLDRSQCLEFAVGCIGRVLGDDYAAIDDHPTRVRLPDEPLMLVDRIISVAGERRSLSQGRVVTEHDILAGDWYLDAGRIPPSIAIESGQADLFLSGYLGIDFVTKGLAVYRLLDATVTFHRELPVAGKVIRYDIRITRFFRQGQTHLFRFEFDGTVDGQPLLTMRDGCAGFFSAEELAAGKGIVPRPLDSCPRAGVKPSDWSDLVPPSRLSLDEQKVEALRGGDLATAFGPPFDALNLAEPLPLPGGRMTLVDRVDLLDQQAGRFGLGLIRAEADIHPDDWFMVCHFVDDHVMPGTLMYECCLHTLRIFLMSLGWVGERNRVVFEPLPGVANRLRCRGQVIASTSKVVYEVVIKELGYAPEPFAIADAMMYADGKPIVEITDMALRLAGTNRDELKRLWSTRHHEPPRQPVVLYSKDRIMAFASGKPSEGFGERYRRYDHGRFIARLPRPPYQFLDRIVGLEGQPWTMSAGTSAVAEYDIPPDAWYFAADRQTRVPYAVVLETALQACGWVAAFMGSALVSSEPLKFRNLGGSACQHAAIGAHSGTLQTAVRATKVTHSAGMIIQHYEFTVRCQGVLVFDGTTYFGFFHPDALAEQMGIRDAAPVILTDAELSRSRSFPLPDQGPFPDQRWRMVQQIDALVDNGGPHGLGLVAGSARVEPDAWFFEAHFLDDPVWPGSLGLESLLQLLKVVASERWGGGEGATFDSPGLAHAHTWVYRGQIVPANQKVTTQAVITARDDQRQWLKADGYLLVDGKVIYQMNDFTLRLDTGETPALGTEFPGAALGR